MSRISPNCFVGTVIFISPSPTKSRVICFPEPNDTFPSRARIVPSLLTYPPRSEAFPPPPTTILPEFSTPFGFSLPLNEYISSRKSLFLISNVEAAKEPVFTTPFLVIATPLGLISNTFPFECI